MVALRLREMTAMALACAAFTLWPLGLPRAPHLRGGSVVMTVVVAALSGR